MMPAMFERQISHEPSHYVICKIWFTMMISLVFPNLKYGKTCDYFSGMCEGLLCVYLKMLHNANFITISKYFVHSNYKQSEMRELYKNLVQNYFEILVKTK